MMTKEGSTKILNFMTPGQGFLYWGVAIYILFLKIFSHTNPVVDTVHKKSSMVSLSCNIFMLQFTIILLTCDLFVQVD